MPLKTMNFGKGTTTIAFKFKEGIIVAVDSRITHEDKIYDKYDKFCSISSNIFCTMMGRVLVWKDMCRHVKQEVKKEECNLNAATTVANASKIAAKRIVEFTSDLDDDDLTFGTIMVGWEENTGFQLYKIILKGNHTEPKKQECAVLGSGTPFVEQFMSTSKLDYKNMSTKDAAAFALKALYCATFFDKLSGGTLYGSTEVHKYDALDAYEMFYENYSCGQNMLFLLSSKDDLPICPDDIKALRPRGVILAAHRLADLPDFYWHRLVFNSGAEASNAFNLLKESCDAPKNVPAPGNFRTGVVLRGTKSTPVYVAESSLHLLKLIRNWAPNQARLQLT